MDIGLIIAAIGFGVPVLCLAAICIFGTIKLIKEMMQ